MVGEQQENVKRSKEQIMADILNNPQYQETDQDGGDVVIPEEANLMSEEMATARMREVLREMFPYGDEQYIAITMKEMEGYNTKNFDYAAGGDPNGNFLRVASILSFYPGIRMDDPRAVAIIYLLKQLDNVLWSLSRGFEGKLEDIDSRLLDIHVYAKIARVLNNRLKAGDCVEYPVSGGPTRATMLEDIRRIVREEAEGSFMPDENGQGAGS